MKALTKVVALLLLVMTPHYVFSQVAPNATSEAYRIYTYFWTGSIAAGNAHTIGIPSTTNTGRPMFLGPVTILTTVDVTVTIRKGAVADPTTVPASFGSTASPSVIAMNNITIPLFRFWPVSDIAVGGYLTSYPFYANDPRTINLDGVMFPSGRSSGRNLSIHFAAAAGNAQISGKVFEMK